MGDPNVLAVDEVDHTVREKTLGGVVKRPHTRSLSTQIRRASAAQDARTRPFSFWPEPPPATITHHAPTRLKTALAHVPTFKHTSPALMHAEVLADRLCQPRHGDLHHARLH